MDMSKGVWASLFAYVIWGFFPIYFHALSGVPAEQTTAHRVVWSFLFISLVILFRREVNAFTRSLSWRKVGIYLLAGVLLAANWGTYVWAVGNGRVVEASLGYFINPIVSVLLGVVFLREKLRSLQWLVAGLAVFGVGFLTFSYGQIPWISLVLAFTFGMYGFIKKLAPLGTLHGLALETMMIFLPALVILLIAEFSGTGAFGHISILATILLALTGIVTAIPLFLFSFGARNVPLSTLGLLQYVTPTIQFLLGIFLYKENFTSSHLSGFIIIWVALIIFTVDSFLFYRRSSRQQRSIFTTTDISDIA
jgi:chloramphenicol-sensitive protein RarD